MTPPTSPRSFFHPRAYIGTVVTCRPCRAAPRQCTWPSPLPRSSSPSSNCPTCKKARARTKDKCGRAKSQREAETGVVLGLLRFQVHVAADNSGDVAYTNVEGDTDRASRRGCKVVGCPGATRWLDWVDAHTRQDDRKEGWAKISTEIAVD